MAYTWLQIFVLTVFVAASAVNAQIVCPICSDPYDPTSCNETQQCDNTHDACRNHETHPCSPTQHESCAYCCATLAECEQQRDDLFNHTYSTFTPPATTPTTTGPPTTSPDMTNTAPVVTSSPSGPTPVMTMTTMTTASTTMTTTTPTTTLAPAGTRCFKCGDFLTDSPCTATEILINSQTICPQELPYCFVNIFHTGSDVGVIKGCAEANFCKLESEITSTKPECNPLDVSAPNFDCAWCCQGDRCNLNAPPSPDTIVTV